jgi:hypothetical protein
MKTRSALLDISCVQTDRQMDTAILFGAQLGWESGTIFANVTIDGRVEW